jgi:hypothetical protein
MSGSVLMWRCWSRLLRLAGCFGSGDCDVVDVVGWLSVCVTFWELECFWRTGGLESCSGFWGRTMWTYDCLLPDCLSCCFIVLWSYFCNFTLLLAFVRKVAPTLWGFLSDSKLFCRTSSLFFSMWSSSVLHSGSGVFETRLLFDLAGYGTLIYFLRALAIFVVYLLRGVIADLRGVVESFVIGETERLRLVRATSDLPWSSSRNSSNSPDSMHSLSLLCGAGFPNMGVG